MLKNKFWQGELIFLILCGHYKRFILSFLPKKIWWENICLRLNKSSYILISLVKHKSNCSLSDLSPIILLFEEQSFQFLDSFYCLHLPTRNTVKCIIWIVFYFKLWKVEFAFVIEMSVTEISYEIFIISLNDF